MKLSSALSVAFLAVVMSRIVSGGINGVVPRFPLDGCNGDEFWHKYEDYCYKLVYFPNGEPGNVFDISAECQNQGPQVDSAGIAYLADIQSRAENDFIANMVTMYEERAWIGAFRFGAGFRWEYSWSQGPRTNITFANWKPKEPNNKRGQENCVEINRGSRGKWNDLLCMRRRPAICKYSIVQWNENQ